jgi:hypothetical protein
MKKNNGLKRCVLLALCPFLFSACGIDSDPSLGEERLPVNVIFNHKAEVTQLSYSAQQQYLLFYKIYISGLNETGTITPDKMSAINTTLAADYNALLPYTPESTATRPLPLFSINTFSSRKFYSLYIGQNEFVSDPDMITLDFSGVFADPDIQFDGTKPYIIYDNDPSSAVYLRRSNGGGTFSPLPENRYFVNTDDLNNAANITTSVNADVANTSQTDITQRYAYCAMYILKRGMNPTTLVPIYGNPVFLTVFRLPEP